MPVAAAATGWDVGRISRALQHEPELARDGAYGSGVRYRLGEQDCLTVELFPPLGNRELGIVRFATEESFQEFHKQPAPAVREEGLIFEVRNLFISLSPTGELMTYRKVDGQEETVVDDSAHASETPIAAAPEPDSEESVSPAPASEKRDGYIPKLVGRMGRDPHFHRTRQGQGRFVGQFPLAVKDEDDPSKTTWHRIVVFDNPEKNRLAATKLQEGDFREGDLVEALGLYRHVSEYIGKDKKPHQKIELYATHVKRRG